MILKTVKMVLKPFVIYVRIHIPVCDGGDIDETYIEQLMFNTPYWNQIESCLRMRVEQTDDDI